MTKRCAVVQGASRGIGLALTRQLLLDEWDVFATCRAPANSHALHELATSTEGLHVVELDVTSEASILAAAQQVASLTPHVHLLLNVAGVLHDDQCSPEKKLQDVDANSLQHVFAVNAFGPLLVAKHFADLLRHEEPSVLANVSARVGSITDNRLGGWYAYRASKAAQNMFTKNLSIELGRRNKNLTVIALHPGTVDTSLSAPFHAHVDPQKLFDAERAARQLLEVAGRVTRRDNGRFLAWDGQDIPW